MNKLPHRDAASRPLLNKTRLHSLLKNSTSRLILGGATVHRCDSWHVFIDGFQPLRPGVTPFSGKPSRPPADRPR
jgi:hypothetical protein